MRGRTIVGLVGSYRHGGTIDTLVDEVLAAASHAGAYTSKRYLDDYAIEFCTNCRQCMQDPGTQRVPCLVHNDDMESLLEELEQADGLVLGAPVNLGNPNALTQRFAERCAGFHYWPWGSPAPKRRRQGPAQRQAVLISASAAPRLMNSSLFGFGTLRTLKTLAKTLGAQVEQVIKVGLINQPRFSPSQQLLRQARRAGQRLTRG